MSLKLVHTSQAPAAIGPYSQATVINDLVFVSGQIPLDPATGQLIPEQQVEAQTKQCLNNLQAILRAAGSRLSLVGKTTVYLKSMDDFVAVNGVYADFFHQHASGHYPARVAVEVSRLPKDVLVEIDCIARIDSSE